MAITGETSAQLADGNSIERRLARIEHLLERLLAPTREVPLVVATAVDTLDGIAADLGARGIDVDERLRNALALLERITAPATLAAMDKLLFLVEDAPGLVAILTDTVDGLIAGAQNQGVDLDGRLRALARLVARATDPAVLEVAEELASKIDQVKALARSGLFDPDTIEALGLVARAMQATVHEGTREIGLFRSVAALRRRRVKPALGFAVGIAEHLGDELAQRDGHEPHALRAPDEPTDKERS